MTIASAPASMQRPPGVDVTSGLSPALRWHHRCDAAERRSSRRRRRASPSGFPLHRARARWLHRCWVQAGLDATGGQQHLARVLPGGPRPRRSSRLESSGAAAAAAAGATPCRATAPDRTRDHCTESAPAPARAADVRVAARVARATSRPMPTSRPYCTPEGQVVSQLQACQATIQMQLACSAWPYCSFQHLFDQVDATARAVEFVAEQLVGWAGGGAEAAVYAIPQNGLGLVARGGAAHEVSQR